VGLDGLVEFRARGGLGVGVRGVGLGLEGWGGVDGRVSVRSEPGVVNNRGREETVSAPSKRDACSQRESNLRLTLTRSRASSRATGRGLGGLPSSCGSTCALLGSSQGPLLLAGALPLLVLLLLALLVLVDGAEEEASLLLLLLVAVAVAAAASARGADVV